MSQVMLDTGADSTAQAGWQALLRAWDAIASAGQGPATLFLDEAAVRRLIAGEASCPALRLPDALRALALAQGCLQVVLPHQGFASFCNPGRLTTLLGAALTPQIGGASLRVLVLAHAVSEQPAGSVVLPAALAALSEGLVHWMEGARRRVPDYFSKRPLVLPFSGGQGPGLHLLEPAALLDCVRHAAPALPPGCHLLHAPALGSGALLLRELALALDIPVAEASCAADTLSELLEESLQQTRQRWQLGQEALLDGQAFDRTVVCGSTPSAWSAAWQAHLDALRQSHLAATAPVARRWAHLPGMRLESIDGAPLRAWRLGEGPQTVLLLNAFGLSLDVWSELALALSPHCSVLALEARDDAAVAAEALSSTYYDSEDSWAQYLQSVRQLLALRQTGPLHLLSWCGGAKFALDLARALPQDVASLCLLAPSYAGVDCGAGGDSSFETSLNTMCRLVQRTPAAADSMARSMLALLKRGDGAADDPQRLWSLPDAHTAHWLHEPYVSADRMRQYSRQLVNFRAHAVSLPPAVEPLAQPCLLIMGDSDTATCAERARAMGAVTSQTLQLGLRAAGHYLIHQDAALVARLLRAFLREGLQLEITDARLRRFTPAEEALVSGEL
ncbi:alpha/beta hydrolase [Mitsuaria sp. WAJ17]|uniref:alpha/beta fold hydrolase n=1 Tax=Mitsuaria sp. WAJ17 TaxID=2761452 RepID=UPI0015FEFCF8|nr:alpha/beta hydrolase [Mitsuaria sp. WAJ17]MBB2487985.1 alpha/beta hydrolase [Mitsuaria sp. WAJ17]